MTALAALIKVRTSDKKYVQEWDEVRKDFCKQKRLRNKLAHWSIMQSQLFQSGDTFVAFLAPPLSDIPRMLKALQDPENGEAISAEGLLKQALEDFGNVNVKIDAFRRSLPPRA